MLDQICPNPAEREEAARRLQNEYLIELCELEDCLWEGLQEFWLEAPRLKVVKEAQFAVQRQREFRHLLQVAAGRSELVAFLQDIREDDEIQLEALQHARKLALELLQDWLAVCRLLPAAYFLTLRSRTPSTPPSSSGGGGSNLPSAPLPDLQIEEEEATECLQAINATLMLEGEPPPDELEDLDPDAPDDDPDDTLDGDVSLTVEVKARMVVAMWEAQGRIPHAP